MHAYLVKMLENTCDGDVSFRSNYSGRGMYGQTCVGLVGGFEDCMKVISSVICEMHEESIRDFEDEVETSVDFSEAVETLLDFRQDSMGLQVIVYWPRLSN